MDMWPYEIRTYSHIADDQIWVTIVDTDMRLPDTHVGYFDKPSGEITLLPLTNNQSAVTFARNLVAAYSNGFRVLEQLHHDHWARVTLNEPDANDRDFVVTDRDDV